MARRIITALFLDISGDPEMKVPTQPERRERVLQDQIRAARKPVVLFIDEAHDLHGNTLVLSAAAGVMRMHSYFLDRRADYLPNG